MCGVIQPLCQPPRFGGRKPGDPGTEMTAYLDRALTLAGPHSQDPLAYLHSWGLVAAIGVAGVVAICVLRGPVMTDRFLAAFGNLAGKFGPKIFYVSAGVLIVGVFINAAPLIILGAVVAGALLLGLIAWHY